VRLTDQNGVTVSVDDEYGKTLKQSGWEVAAAAEKSSKSAPKSSAKPEK
jgi:hypothetical protein